MKQLIWLAALGFGALDARRPGEVAYVRFGTRGDTVTGRFEEGGEARALFLATADGSLVRIP